MYDFSSFFTDLLYFLSVISPFISRHKLPINVFYLLMFNSKHILGIQNAKQTKTTKINIMLTSGRNGALYKMRSQLLVNKPIVKLATAFKKKPIKLFLIRRLCLLNESAPKWVVSCRKNLRRKTLRRIEAASNRVAPKAFPLRMRLHITSELN